MHDIFYRERKLHIKISVFKYLEIICLYLTLLKVFIFVNVSDRYLKTAAQPIKKDLALWDRLQDIYRIVDSLVMVQYDVKNGFA